MTVDELMREALRSLSENARAEELRMRLAALLASYSTEDMEKWDAFMGKLLRMTNDKSFNPSTQAELDAMLESKFPGMLRDERKSK